MNVLMKKLFHLKINDFKIDDEKHWSFLIDDNINKAVEI